MKSPERAPSVLHTVMFITALGGIALALVAGLLFGMMGVVTLLEGLTTSALPALWSMAGMLALAAVLVPPAYWSGRAVFGAPDPPASRPAAWWLLLILAYPLCLAFGWWGQTNGAAGLILGPAALTGTACLSVLFVGWLVRRLGPPVSPLRAWGHFTVGVTAMPVGALLFEVAVLIPALVVFGVWMMTTPEGRHLASYLQQASPDPDQAMTYVSGLLKSPLVLAGIYGYAALAIPVIEESLKTMAIWPFLRRGLPGNEAFLGGALGGAGYALFEALFLTQPGDVWLATTLARVGATLLHVFTASLTSWGLMEGVRRRRYFVTIATFVVGVTMHGLWNLAAVTIGFASLPMGSAVGPFPDGTGTLAALLLLILILIAGLGLVFAWRRLAGRDLPA